MKFAKWIWENREDHADEYVRFFQTFESNGGDVSIDLSCDSNYELYVNGKLAGFGQYADYPYYKVFDRIDITPYCYAGINHISILVWYFGKGFSTYYKGLPGLIFEISEGDRILAFSSKLTLCRKALDYQSGKQKIITKQLGFSFAYDASMYNGCNCETFEAIGYKPAVEVCRSMWALHIRPIEKIVLKAFKEAKRIQGKHWVYDLGGETVGYLSLRFKSSIHSLVRVSYGEHLVKDENGDDRVPRIISNRDFSVELYGNGEWFEFSNFMRRLGCRYLQVDCDSDVEIESIGLYPVEYPVIVKPFDAKNPLRQKIYDVCVDTLRFCMFEHYEDCPWREQALYNLDSRNQMLCGYYAFDEYLFPKASLELFGRDRRDDGLLHITAPAAESLVIPSFTLFWILQMKEYAEFIGDVSLVETYYTKMKEILNVFFDRQENGLIPNFYGDKQYWNFYEWNPTLQGTICQEQEKSFDLVLNALVSWMSQCMIKMASMIGKHDDVMDYAMRATSLNEKINQCFYCEEDGVYVDAIGTLNSSQLGNSLAILCGAAEGKRAELVCEKMVNEKYMIETTLSMKAFRFDALLKVNSQKYTDYVLTEIDRDWGYMLDQGATSFWETLDGAEAFTKSGSLCHGWSAIPIIYYHRLLD